MKKLIVILFFLSVKLIGQSRMEGQILSKNEWSHYVGKFFPLSNDTLYLATDSKLGVPEVWLFDNESGVNKLFVIDSTTSLLVMPHGGVLGRYVFYFNKEQSYVQPFFQLSDKTLCYNAGKHIYVIESFTSETLYGTYGYAYTIFNNKFRKFSTQIINFYGRRMKIEKILNNDKQVKFGIRSGCFKKEYILFDVEKNLFLNEHPSISNDAVYKTQLLQSFGE